jgi:predicted CXXCH cytochrome family protein
MPVNPPTLRSVSAVARRRLGLRTSLIAAGAAAAILAVSCATGARRTVVIPPAMPGATYVGSDTCEQCHDTITRDFPTAAHAKLIARGPEEIDIGCESCHGPASVHVESGGAARTLIHPNRNPESCFVCHSDVRGQFALPHRHPVTEHGFGCSACHEPHRGDSMRAGASSLMSERDQCLQCHRAQQGPHIFEHEAMREGCSVCHHPHGSVNQKLLTERNAILCLKCHFQQPVAQGGMVIGAVDHTAFLSRGACWSSGCHEAVHGSQVSSSLRF